MPSDKPIVRVEDLGRMDYQAAWDYQTLLHQALVQAKRPGQAPADSARPKAHHLLFVEHPHVYTLGKSGKEAHLLIDEAERARRGVAFYRINRGGDITYHGPGQLVAYPILDFDDFFHDVHRYVRYLEEAVIRTLAALGIPDATRIEGLTGVWLPAEGGRPQRKVCAIGVHLSRWVSMHGLALNVNTDLSYFGHIVPCGIADADKAVSSIAAELGRPLDMAVVRAHLLAHLAELFGFVAESA